MRSLRYTAMLLALLGCVASGCGSDDDDDTTAPTATPTPTATRTTTPTADPTVTPTPEQPMHNENLFGSTEAGGGALTVDAAAHVETPFSACLGGSGDACSGGTALYIASDPGFEEAEEDEPDEPLYALVDGITVTLEITAIDPGVSLKFDDVLLNAAGQSVLIGTTPGVHRDLEWQLALPGGAIGSRQVSFKLTTTAAQYSASEAVTVTLDPVAAK